jgi:nucleoside 2-deoxyribosyltransferase
MTQKLGTGGRPALVYLAGPLFSEAERRFNAEATARLEAAGFEVYLPQRDTDRGGDIASSLAPAPFDNDQFPRLPLSGSPEARKLSRTIFERDLESLLAADIVVVVLDGRVPDEGACVELGIAFGSSLHGGRKKLLLGLMSDSRTAFAWTSLNPMVAGALDQCVADMDGLVELLGRRFQGDEPSD